MSPSLWARHLPGDEIQSLWPLPLLLHGPDRPEQGDATIAAVDALNLYFDLFPFFDNFTGVIDPFPEPSFDI